MDFLKRLLGMTKNKPFKIQDVGGRKVGIVASSLKDLRKKGALKLNLKSVNCVVLQTDGTKVEDEEYFKLLEPQTVFVFLQEGETWQGEISYLIRGMNLLIENSTGKEIISRARELQKNEPELLHIVEYIKSRRGNINAESKEEDPEWFIGLKDSFITKSSVLRKSANARIRGYLSKSKEFGERNQMTNANRRKYMGIMDQFHNELKTYRYFEVYFDRTANDDSKKLCDQKGWFACQGAFDKENCDFIHQINPYLSHGHRILFSTWNLDHKIEKSRVILPKLKEAIEKCPKKKRVNWLYFFQLLFTLDNLKLVDICCHKKDKHVNFVVDENKIYTS